MLYDKNERMWIINSLLSVISRAQVLCECVSIYYVSVYVFQETNVF